MTFHLPIENWQPSGAPYDLSPEIIGTSSTCGMGGDAVENYNFEVDFSAEDQTYGCIIGAAAAVGSLIFPEAALTPPGWVIIGLMAATSYELSLSQPPTPQIKSISPTAAMLESDFDTLLTSELSNNHDQLDPTINKTLLAELRGLDDSPEEMSAWIGDAVNNNFISYNFTLYHTPCAQAYFGDQYGPYGYVGPVEGHVIFENTIVAVDHWMWGVASGPVVQQQ
jgi:hypothetical protein